MLLIGGVARAFDLNMVPEAVSRKLEPMVVSVQEWRLFVLCLAVPEGRQKHKRFFGYLQSLITSR